MLGNLMDPPRWPKGRARRFLARHVFALVTMVGIGGVARAWLLADVDLQEPRRGAPSTGHSQVISGDLKACADELAETTSNIARLRATIASRARPGQLLGALSESVPADAWITSVHARGDEVELVAQAQTERGIQRTLYSLEESQRVSEIRLLSTNLSDPNRDSSAIEFRVTGRLRTKREVRVGH